MSNSFPALLPHEVALAYAEYATGIVLTLAGDRKIDPTASPYHVYASEQEAVQAARAFLRGHPTAEALIFGPAQKLLHHFTPLQDAIPST